MLKRQIIPLFVCSFVPWAVAKGLIPLLPVYARQLGANPALAGYYLAFIYIAIAMGAISAGWVSDTYNHRRIPVILVGLVSIPVAGLMGRAGNIWTLSILTAVLWFCVGLGLGLVGILAGLSAGENERGKIFGILSITCGLGGLIGSLAAGFLADLWGYPRMFTAVAGLILLWPLSGYFLTEKWAARDPDEEAPEKERPGLGRQYYLLFSASLAVSIAGFVILLGRSLLMEDLEFGALDISITSATSGIVAMTLPFLMGWLSDRIGRKPFLYLSYLAGLLSLAVIAVSDSLWQFVIVIALQSFSISVNSSIGNAFVTDLVPAESLGRALSLFGATTWIGGILGFAATGNALQTLGPSITFYMGMCLPLASMALLFLLRTRGSGGESALSGR